MKYLHFIDIIDIWEFFKFCTNTLRVNISIYSLKACPSFILSQQFVVHCNLKCISTLTSKKLVSKFSRTFCAQQYTVKLNPAQACCKLRQLDCSIASHFVSGPQSTGFCCEPCCVQYIVKISQTSNKHTPFIIHCLASL